MKYSFGLVFTVLLQLAVGVSAQTVYYVDQGSVSDGPGNDWEHAYHHVQDALAVAEPGDQVRVAEGIYRPDESTLFPTGTGDRLASFQLDSNLALLGGYAGYGAADPDECNAAAYVTILSGDLNGDDFPGFVYNSENSYHVFYHPFEARTDLSTVLDGFTISGGNADGPQPHDRGGGMANDGGELTITNCIFDGNWADMFGGAVANYSSSPIVENCTFTNNEVFDTGGGMWNFGRFGNAKVTNCVFSRNSAYAGGAFCSRTTANPIVTNCTFADNYATSSGGGILSHFNSNPKVTNCIFWGNISGDGSQIQDAEPPISVTFSCVQGGYDGEGNIDADPRFVASSSANQGGGQEGLDTVSTVIGDYHLQADSPCINTGDDMALPEGITTDFEGDERIAQCRIDMGADETPHLGVDCNGNVQSDACDTDLGESEDCNTNRVPDECEPGGDQDCNLNETSDLCDIFTSSSPDCDRNGVPDECEALPAGRLYVDDSATSGANTGSSWANAFLDLHQALSYVADCGGFSEIWVAQGTYLPNTAELADQRLASFSLINGLAIYGGFPTGGSEMEDRSSVDNETILSGDIGLVGDPDDNCYHVLRRPFGPSLDATAVLDGVTITGGNANGSYPHNCGGGMYNDQDSPTLINCLFRENKAQGGGAIYNDYQCATTALNCIFAGNSATFGAGIYNYASDYTTIVNCTFAGNRARLAGMLYSSGGGATVRNCVAWDNPTTEGRQIHGHDLIVSHSCIQGGYEGQGNIDTDPRLADLGYWDDNGSPQDPSDDSWVNGDYHLQIGSPCIDAGHNDALLTSMIIDFEGDARVQHCLVDMGADETPYFRDCNTNGTADACETTAGTAEDCNGNLVPDLCEPGGGEDCNSSSTSDLCDIFMDQSRDCNDNAVPDECEELPSGILFVDDSATSGAEDGSSWTNAYLNLNDALHLARCSVGEVFEIRIAQGIYTPGEFKNSTFQLINDVTISGGFRGTHPDDPGQPNDRDVASYETILSCDLLRNDGPDFTNTTDNCYQVFFHPQPLVLNHTAVLDGVTISGGAAFGPEDRSSGGGMSNVGSSPTVINCTFRDNQAYRGGGMYAFGSSLLLRHCAFTANSADYGGGAIYAVNSEMSLTNCTLSMNTNNQVYYGGGGGIYFDGASSAVLDYCSFSDNYSSSSGGGIYLISSGGALQMSHCTFVGNSAEEDGGALFLYSNTHHVITNSVFRANSAGEGAGVYSYFEGSLTITNSTFADNTASRYGGAISDPGATCEVTNCILWGNTPDEIDTFGDPAVTYSCVAGGYAGEGNISTDPLLVGSSDVRLSADSPSRNTGSNSATYLPNLDLDGHSRVLCSRVDMGAYEFGIGDYDCDTSVELLDYANWATCMTGPSNGPYPSGCEAFDFEFDADVDLNDVARFQAAFGG